MNRYLIEERPLTVLPSLVNLVGMEKAVVLQQLYWLQNQPNSGRVLDDGHKWIWGTYDEWCERYFPFWRGETLRKHISGLEKKGLLVSCQPNVEKWDRTKYYRVDVAKLSSLIEPEDVTAAKRKDSENAELSIPTEPEHPTASERNIPPHRGGGSHRFL